MMRRIICLLTVLLIFVCNSFTTEIPNYHLGTIEVKGTFAVKSKARVEGSVQGSISSDSQSESKLSLGTFQNPFYVMLVAELTKADGFRLSNDYQENAIEDGGRRENSDQLKKSLYLKAGVIPSTSSEFFIAYNRNGGCHHGSVIMPVTGAIPIGTKTPFMA